MQSLASLLSLLIITGYVVGSCQLETGLFPHRLLNTQLKKVSVDYCWKQLVGLVVKGTVAFYLVPLAKMHCLNEQFCVLFLSFIL